MTRRAWPAEEARIRRAIPDSPYLLDVICLLERDYKNRTPRRTRCNRP